MNPPYWVALYRDVEGRPAWCTGEWCPNEALAQHITEIIRSGNRAQRKTLIEALVAEVKITGRGAVTPVYRIPQPGPN